MLIKSHLNIPLLARRGGSRPSKASVWRRGGGCFFDSTTPAFIRLRQRRILILATPPGQEGNH